MSSLSKILFVVCVSAMLSLSCFGGTAGGGSRVGGVDVVPTSNSIVVDFETPTRMRVTMTAVYEGEDASAMRTLFDIDADGNINAAEVTTYMDKVNGPLDPVDRQVSITMDGNEPMGVEMSFSVEGAEGTVNSADPFKITFLESIQFPEADSKTTHTYGFEGAEEFVGGDEPWDDEFVGGDEPWDNEFIGDDPWDNRVDFQFNFVAPEGWVFDQTNWPSGLSDYVGLDGSTIQMDGLEVREQYNRTFGSLDSLVIGTGVDIVQTSIIIEVDFESVELLKITMIGTFDGDSAAAMRMLFDLNFDGVVSAAEAASYLATINGPLEVIDTDVPITLDGQGPTKVEMSFSVEGAVGDIDSGEQFKIIFVEKVEFTLPEDQDRETHTYDLTGAEEWVGGDEPWDDEFVGGDEPWDNEFVGGDEPWDNRVDVQFSMTCPDGWTFKSGKWPAGMEDFLNQEGTGIDMDDAAVKASYVSTVGSQDSLIIQKEDDDGNGSPGFGVLIAILAVAIATFTIVRGRRR